MREIKFRAWDSTRKVFVKVNDVCDIDNDGVLYPAMETLRPEKEVTLMQFTGLKDKNGTEIYEGDIVRFKAFGGKQQGVIRWNEGGASYQIEMSSTSSTGFFEDQARAYEVIGNIHENPELLS